jgi:hypothetical protein
MGNNESTPQSTLTPTPTPLEQQKSQKTEQNNSTTPQNNLMHKRSSITSIPDKKFIFYKNTQTDLFSMNKRRYLKCDLSKMPQITDKNELIEYIHKNYEMTRQKEFNEIKEHYPDIIGKDVNTIMKDEKQNIRSNLDLNRIDSKIIKIK